MEVINFKGRNKEEVYNAIAAEELAYIGDHQYQGGWKLKQTKWYNPYHKLLKQGYTREQVLLMYKEYLLKNEQLLNDLPELKGKTLGCWCNPEACHGDVLIELVEAGRV